MAPLPSPKSGFQYWGDLSVRRVQGLTDRMAEVMKFMKVYSYLRLFASQSHLFSTDGVQQTFRDVVHGLRNYAFSKNAWHTSYSNDFQLKALYLVFCRSPWEPYLPLATM